GRQQRGRHGCPVPVRQVEHRGILEDLLISPETGRRRTASPVTPAGAADEAAGAQRAPAIAGQGPQPEANEAPFS
ncbi:MAG: hypothetical protein WAU86_05990, partial [Oricola sp.]